MDTNPYSLSLTPFERITLGNNLPPQGDFVLMTCARQCADRLNLTKDEMSEMGIVRTEEGQITIPPDAMKTEAVVEIGQVMFLWFKKFFKDKDANSNLAMGETTLYEKFVEGTKPALSLEA